MYNSQQGHTSNFHTRDASRTLTYSTMLSPSKILSQASGGGSHIAIAVRDTARALIGRWTRGIARTPIGRVHLFHSRHLTVLFDTKPYILLIDDIRKYRISLYVNL